MNLKDNLVRLRKENKLSQEQLADLLKVSRQTISKWENGATYPELDKLLKICEVFSISMDDLIKEKEATTDELFIKYDKFKNRMASYISIAIGLIFFGVIMLIYFNSFNEKFCSLMGFTFFICFVCVSVAILVYYGIQSDKFAKNKIKLNYSKEEIKKFKHKFSIMLPIGVLLIVIGIVLMLFLNKVLDSDSCLPIITFLLFLTIGVMIFVYYGILDDKYFRRLKAVSNKKEETLEQITSIIIIIAIVLFLMLGFLFKLWAIAWVLIPIGGIMCAIIETKAGKRH